MAATDYSPVSLHENGKEYDFYQRKHSKYGTKSVLGNIAVAVVCFALGFGLRDSETSIASHSHREAIPHRNGRLPPQSFIPESMNRREFLREHSDMAQYR